MSLPNISREYRSQGDGHQNLKLQSASLSKPKATEATIKIHAVSLQYRDLMVSKGLYPQQKTDIIPCSDGAGEIVAVGQDVKGWKVGDRVCPNFAVNHIHGDVTEEIKLTGLGGHIDGVLREYINVPVHSLVRIPEHLSYEEGSTLPCAALTAYNAFLGPVPLKGGDYVLASRYRWSINLLVSAPNSPLLLVQPVILTSSSDEKLQVAKKLGVQHVINYKKNEQWDEEVLKITGGRGVDHIIEVGGPNTMLKCMNAVRYAGWIHIIGFVSGGNNGIPIGLAIQKAIFLRGILIGSVKQFEDMNRLITAHRIRPVIDKVFSFEEATDAYAYLDSQKHVGKVVIKLA
ncbi:chaperonin 10-like protein [Suillus paluster]|uniref:chaperonin 10-like protein n=1 Tax=Suillus paluster TaxID=48578 RepID=UPI001B860358|nr:chaperonin 10-like protein [Suillus paluster]KAG1732679.1 chaperonin 10-like protein [Suillus paluster]